MIAALSVTAVYSAPQIKKKNQHEPKHTVREVEG